MSRKHSIVPLIDEILMQNSVKRICIRPSLQKFAHTSESRTDTKVNTDVHTNVHTEVETEVKTEVDTEPEIKLDGMQKKVLEKMKAGENIVIMGEAGTGKSTVIGEFRKWCKAVDKKVGVTAMTGKAAASIDGVTIHSWSGYRIGPGKETMEDFVARNYKNKHGEWKHYKLITTVQATNVLIIDEISMMSTKMIFHLNSLLCLMRESSEFFGGLQVILVGDFFQLPPVDKGNYGPPPYCFKSELFQREFPPSNCFELDVVYRQRDIQFLNALRHIRCNRLPMHKESCALIKERATHVVPENAPRLLPLRRQVDTYNCTKMSQLTGKEHVCKAMNEYDAYNFSAVHKTIMESFNVQKVFRWKVGAKVIYTVNSPDINKVNGSVGEITKESEDGYPIVKFVDGDTLTVRPVKLKQRYDKRNPKCVQQIPLMIAFAVTVHKSQGMTLDSACIDMTRMFGPGMAYTALTRLRDRKGLYFHNQQVDLTKCFTDADVLKFYDDLRAQQAARHIDDDIN